MSEFERRERRGIALRRYPNAVDALESAAAAKAFLVAQLGHPTSAATLVDDVKRWLNPDPKVPTWTFEALAPDGTVLRGDPVPVRTSKSAPGTDEARRRFLADARRALASCRALCGQLEALEVQFPAFERTPSTASESLIRSHLIYQSRRYAKVVELGVPDQLAMSTGPLPRLADDLANAIAVFARAEVPPLKPQSMASARRDCLDDIVASWAAIELELTAKLLAAAEVLAAKRPLSNPALAAARVKVWDTELAEARRRLGLPRRRPRTPNSNGGR